MGAKLVPLTFDLIEEGRFAANVDADLQQAMGRLIAYVREHGTEMAEGAKAELNVKITLKFDGPEESDYSVKGAISTKLPGRPSHVSRAVCTEEQTGEETLFVRASGSDATTPRQAKLATDDGRAIDPTTGRARPA